MCPLVACPPALQLNAVSYALPIPRFPLPSYPLLSLCTLPFLILSAASYYYFLFLPLPFCCPIPSWSPPACLVLPLNAFQLA
mmetsp:Transcript_70585/g.117207  ORF Transcript_70585/g.117207 Transcript_70585/m.117207 type:complete len:82 (-) Transcript_70585:262-507(-)